jgi:hypothetical protein
MCNAVVHFCLRYGLNHILQAGTLCLSLVMHRSMQTY